MLEPRQIDRETSESIALAKRARRRRDERMLVGISLASGIVIIWVLWMSGALLPATG